MHAIPTTPKKRSSARFAGSGWAMSCFVAHGRRIRSSRHDGWGRWRLPVSADGQARRRRRAEYGSRFVRQLVPRGATQQPGSRSRHRSAGRIASPFSLRSPARGLLCRHRCSARCASSSWAASSPRPLRSTQRGRKIAERDRSKGRRVVSVEGPDYDMRGQFRWTVGNNAAASPGPLVRHSPQQAAPHQGAHGVEPLAGSCGRTRSGHHEGNCRPGS